METEKLSDSFVDTIVKNEKGLSLITDLTDFSIKNIFDSPLNDLPIVKYILGITKFGISIRDSFLIKKILTFLKETQNIDQVKKEEFKKKMESDKKYKKKVGENLILILDRFDHLTKAKYLAELFNAYLDERITYQELLRLSSSIERAFIADLNNLSIYYSRNLEEVDDYVLQNLYQCGLVSLLFNRITSMVVDQTDVQSAIYVRNELGLILCKIISDYPQDSQLIVPTLSDLENNVFEGICKKESLDEDYFDFENFINELKLSFSLDNQALTFIISKFKNLSLLENAKQYADGNYHVFNTSFTGYNFYFNKLKNRNEFLKQIINALVENQLRESNSFCQENKLSQKMVDHCLILLLNKGLILMTKHVSGILIDQINKLELEKFTRNLED